MQTKRDQFLNFFLKASAGISAGVILLVGLLVARESVPALSEIGLTRFYRDPSWNPTSSKYNVVPMIVGTLAAAGGSLLISAPIGIGASLFLNFYARAREAWWFRRAVEILSGIPSVVYGLWGMTVIVPYVAKVSPLGQGQSLLAGVLILALMTLPTIILAVDAAIRSVSDDQVRAAAALGLGRRAIAWSVVLPASRSGILSGVVLQLGRALGETMAVLMICGNIAKIPGHLFDPVRTLTANIALEMGYADSQHRSVLFATGFLLLLIVSVVMIIADRLSSKIHLAP